MNVSHTVTFPRRNLNGIYTRTAFWERKKMLLYQTKKCHYRQIQVARRNRKCFEKNIGEGVYEINIAKIILCSSCFKDCSFAIHAKQNGIQQMSFRFYKKNSLKFFQLQSLMYSVSRIRFHLAIWNYLRVKK